MNHNEPYEKIANYLDGQPVDLTVQEQELAHEIQADQANLARVLDIAPDRAVMDRTCRKMAAALAGKKRNGPILRFGPLAALATAAAVLLAVILSPVFTGKTPVYKSDSSRDLAALVTEIDSSPSGMIDIMAAMSDDNDQLERDMAAVELSMALDMDI